MPELQSTYAGPERRRRRVYLTRNTEYHFVGDVCVAVRHRESGRWRLAHAALQRTLAGVVSFSEHGELQPKSGPPRVGDALFFTGARADVITTTLTEVARPLPQVIQSYPA